MDQDRLPTCSVVGNQNLLSLRNLFLLYKRLSRNKNDPDHWFDYGAFCLLIGDYGKVREHMTYKMLGTCQALIGCLHVFYYTVHIPPEHITKSEHIIKK